MGLIAAAAMRLRCLLSRFMGIPGGCSAGLVAEVRQVLEKAVETRHRLEESVRMLYREGLHDEARLAEALLDEIAEVENLLLEIEYLLHRLGLGEGLSE